MRGKRARLVRDAEFLELFCCLLHDIPIAGAAHHNADQCCLLAHTFSVPMAWGCSLNLFAHARSAARMVLTTSIVIVIGPTPPGTGDTYAAFAATDAKSMSPASLPFSRRLMPTSITAAPSFTISPLIKPGLPVAITSISACRVIAPRSGVLELQIVTVAPSCSNINAIGLQFQDAGSCR